MADNKTTHTSGRARIKAGILPEVREIKKPDFTEQAVDIEKAEAERVLVQEEQEAVMEEAVVSSEDQLDKSAISTEPRWYVAHTYSGYENKVKTNLETTIRNRHLENQIFEVQIPMQDVVEVKNGVRRAVPRKMFPGYVLVRMVMNDDTWYVVRNTRGVTGFVGPGSKPVPLSENEMKPLGIQNQNVAIDFEVGDMVAVVAGVWKDTIGVAQKIDFSKQSVTINIELFGRETPVEIGFAEVRKTN